MRTVTGHYSSTGYRIELNGVVVYSADPHGALTLTTLRKYCERAAEEIAEERNAKFGGVFEEENE